MKSTSLIATVATVFFLPALLFAQSPPLPPGAVPALPRVRVQAAPGLSGTPEILPDNYQVTLTMTEKDGAPQELSVVTASTNFSALLAEQNLSFSGTIAVEEGGAIRVNSAVSWTIEQVHDGNTSYRTASVSGSALLKSGQEIVIFHAGTRTAKLLVAKLELAK